MTKSPAGRYWIHPDRTGYVDRIYYFGPEGAQYFDLEQKAWSDLPDDLSADDVPNLDYPSSSPRARRPRAPITLHKPMVHRVAVEGVTYEWEGAFTMETVVDIGGKFTTVDKILAPEGLNRDWLLHQIQTKSRAARIAAGTTTHATPEDFGRTLAQRFEGHYVLEAPAGGSGGEPVWRLAAPQHSGTSTPPTLWDDAVAALEQAHAYPMLTPEYRAAVQRSYQLLEQVTALDEPEAEAWQDEAGEIARKLAVYLSIDWTDVDVVEVRYADGNTEVLHIATDPESRERLRDAVAVRFPDAPE